MSSTNSTSAKTSALDTGDAAVTGLFYGLAAGLAMGVYLVLAALSQGVGVIELWSSFAGVLSNPLFGFAGHLAVSAVYGLVWGLLWRTLHRWLPHLPAWVAGLGYGLALLAIAQTAVIALNPLLMGIGLSHRLVAHLVYGLALGILTTRSKQIQS